ncbi:MAG: hypothetical protein HZC40_18825 [Chloroflexi bacterium]|nr:hypothetical protein [Chloroflexota bacterium]
MDTLTLDQFLEQITDENIHSEIDTGPAIGKEEWYPIEWDAFMTPGLQRTGAD